MKRPPHVTVLLECGVLGFLLLLLPAAGILLSGRRLGPYLEFPPRTRFIPHADFSWAAFVVFSVLFAAMAVFVGILWKRSRYRGSARRPPATSFPWWGWTAAVFGAMAWFLAWNRFSWFSALQPYTFTPLWLSYIVVMNALAFRRAGTCFMLEHPWRFLALFPASALFWWFFEYLNRFVQNWHYVGVTFDACSYFLHATCSFSTVLPAVLSTRAWLLTFPAMGNRFEGVFTLRPARPRRPAWGVLFVAAGVLAGIGIWPDYLFPALWVAPLGVIVSLQSLAGRRQPFRPVAQGNWRPVVSWALAAMVCGFFWEMWNMWSLARWEYTVPFVDRFHVFEMPLLGYAGYLPFGIECAAVTDFLTGPAESE